MQDPLLFSIVESPAHPDFSRLYRRLGFEEIRLGSMRKAIGQLKMTPPDIVVAEFFYGYGNNYLLTILLENFDEITKDRAVKKAFADFAAEYGAPAGGGMKK